ncbi:MAG: ABC transporter substrate-binding protein [Alphaproteobacteria bacterium]|jgi:peptide/nickel transport system substrate-binding protein|nr:ABC transporter substrate-binding protein [Alphaproteobacteria bacterium]MDP6815428.1 ABC transporter substrate-binding protein [Alphaproteobacteria bacterium]
MSEHDRKNPLTQTRREFLATTAAAAGAAAAASVPGAAVAAPKRGGTLRFATRVDGRGLDPHRNIIYYVSNPLAATTQGLLDLNTNMEIVPGIGEEWDISDDLMTYTFKIKKGVEFHNGRDVDAEAIKWNYERIMDPKTSHSFTRASLKEVKEITAVDKQTLRIQLKAPSGVFLANVVYYPCNLIAPDSADQADTHPIGCGPFKFVSWKRYAKTEMVRFENYFETDAAGNRLPYLDAIEGYPKKEDKVRLTALRTGEVDLIENMAYSDATNFKKTQMDKYNTWDIPQVGAGYLAVQAKKGPFAMSAADGKLMRQALAHAIDREAIHHAIFNGLSEKLTGFYSTSSPWHMPGIRNIKEFDPEKSKAILRKLNAMNTPIAVVARDTYSYMHQTGELVYSMLQEAGFKPTNEVFDNPVLRKKYKKADYGIDSTANSYRFEPDGWYSRNVLSSAPSTKLRTGYMNEQVDKLIVEARSTRDFKKRKELYTEVESLVNDDCALIYTHCIPLTSAATKNLKGYQPAFAGPFNINGGGVRTAYFA